ncbi:MAG: hypothetical protein QOF27_529 [Gaiellaceae bacterium]|nr:hypothetical protein [Gaiellaceae bacterium]
MGASMLLEAYCIGGAGLAFWVLVRFPEFGPRSLLGATGALMVAFAVAAVVPALLSGLVGDSDRTGGLIGLLGLVLPVLAAIFWSAGCLLRAFCGLLGGMR